MLGKVLLVQRVGGHGLFAGVVYGIGDNIEVASLQIDGKLVFAAEASRVPGRRVIESRVSCIHWSVSAC